MRFLQMGMPPKPPESICRISKRPRMPLPPGRDSILCIGAGIVPGNGWATGKTCWGTLRGPVRRIHSAMTFNWPEICRKIGMLPMWRANDWPRESAEIGVPRGSSIARTSDGRMASAPSCGVPMRSESRSIALTMSARFAMTYLLLGMPASFRIVASGLAVNRRSRSASRSSACPRIRESFSAVKLKASRIPSSSFSNMVATPLVMARLRRAIWRGMLRYKPYHSR